MKRSSTLDIISFLFIFLFIYAAASKLLDFGKFNIQISRSSILSPYAKIIIWLIPGLEFIFAALLALPKWRTIGLYGSFTLMLLFTEYIIAITRFTDNIPCSCGGILQNLSWNQHLIFNLSFIILGLVGILLSKRPRDRSFNG